MARDRGLLHELAAAVERGDFVPVVGDGAVLARGGATATEALHREVARCLSTACPTEPMLPSDLPSMAAAYEALRGRRALVEAYRRSLRGSGPSPVLSRLADMVGATCVTTSVTDACEEAMAAAHPGRHLPVLTDPVGAEYLDHQSTPWIVHLCGALAAPDTLRITQDDQSALISGSDRLSLVVRHVLLTRTLVFCGYSLQDPALYHVHSLLPPAQPHGRRRYLLVEEATEAEREIWRRRGYDLLLGPPEQTLEAIQNARRRTGQSLGGQARPSAADKRDVFRFLDYYTEEDSAYFYGREEEIATIRALVGVSRFTLLTGASGTGKTSLVNAGLVPALHADGYDTYTIRALTHPAAEIAAALGAGIAAEVTAPGLSDFLREVLGEHPTVIIVDQFEEFFLRVGVRARADFTRELAGCLRSAAFDLRVVVVVREDHLHRLLELEPPISGVFRHRYWLRNLDPAQARAAIERTCSHFGVAVEAEFVGEMIADAVTDGSLEPAQLQIICHAVLTSGSADRRALTRAAYVRLGRAAGILASYLQGALHDIEPPLQGLAGAILKSMVTVDRTKAALSAHEISRDAIVRRSGAHEADVGHVIELLLLGRIIRSIPDHPGMYELAHDVMASTIWSWIEPADVELKYVSQVLRQIVSDWRQVGALPAPAQWGLVEKYRADLALTSDEVSLAIQVALHYGSAVDYWLPRGVETGLDVFAELDAILQPGGDPYAQYSAVDWIGEQSPVEGLAVLRRALSNELTGVRNAARRWLSAHSDEPGVTAWLADTPEEPTFIRIPAGPFLFGCNDPRFEHSGPEQTLHLDEYWIARYPVTNVDYACFVASGQASPPEYWRGNQPPRRLLDHPVVQVSWHEATRYCHWYAQTTGLPVRLPTAAQWEKAAGWDQARGRRYLWGWADQFDRTRGNSRIGGPGHTTAVGQYSPAGGDSPYGCADMCGNTFDWVADWWTPSHAHTAARNPTGPQTGEHKAARGGSWAGSAEGTSAVSNKYSLAPETRNEYVGFRLVTHSLEAANDIDDPHPDAERHH